MMALVASTVVCFVLWLLLTFNGKAWGTDEIIAGIIFSIIGGAITAKLVEKDYKPMSALRWLMLIAYLPRFFYEMAKANFDVAYRVITGKINPGIVKLKPDLKNNLSVTILANSITLTPGTLTVDVDEEKNLYIHWINVKDKFFEEGDEKCRCRYVCSTFPDWARRLGE
ncbi:MAG TPA: cation:proton antiporter [Thermoplasmatales archaeon]|nr:cation:proton antiporter [Thermoplasmatales archaeon]